MKWIIYPLACWYHGSPAYTFTFLNTAAFLFSLLNTVVYWSISQEAWCFLGSPLTLLLKATENMYWRKENLRESKLTLSRICTNVLWIRNLCIKWIWTFPCYQWFKKDISYLIIFKSLADLNGQEFVILDDWCCIIC